MTDETVVANLRAARDRLTRGWVQQQMYRRGGGVCLVGAVVGADDLTSTDGWSSETIRATYGRELVLLAENTRWRTQIATCQPSVGEPNWALNRVIAYNDAPRRTVEQVLATVDRAIAAAEEQMAAVPVGTGQGSEADLVVAGD